MILYCTLLAQAQDTERLAIEKEMAERPELSKILAQLRETDASDIVQVAKT
jgi:hypothetical protein